MSGMDWFVADWHLDHNNIIKYCRRMEFMTSTEKELLEMSDKGTIPSREVRISDESTHRMTEKILESTNSVVQSGDRIWILGDTFFARKHMREVTARKYRQRIKSGVTVNVIMGNHDEYPIIRNHFADSVFEQKMITVNQQKIFLNHYPLRSWDCAFHGAWMLYGHVHNMYQDEDNGRLSPFFNKYYTEGFHEVIEEYEEFHHVKDDVKKNLVKSLVEVVAANNGIQLTLDVGVDNQIRPDVPFGTPWSMDDLRAYFSTKLFKWKERQEQFRNFSV